MSKKQINLFVGSVGAFIGVFVFIAYIPQIIANLQGEKAQPFQPLFAAVSCLIWVIYGWTKEPKKCTDPQKLDQNLTIRRSVFLWQNIVSNSRRKLF